MNFEVFTTSVELQDIPSYTTNITLEGQTLRLSFLWNERLGKRVLSIKSSTDVCYLQNTILYPNESFEFNSNAVFDDLPYKVVLQKTGDIQKIGNLYNWSKDYILVFYRTVDEEVSPLVITNGALPVPTTVPDNNVKVCVGANKKVILGQFTALGYYDVKINGVLNEGIIGFRQDRLDLKNLLSSYGVSVTPLDVNLQEVLPVDNLYSGVYYASFTYLEDEHIDLEIKVVDASQLTESVVDPDFGENTTVEFLTSPSTVKFCLE